MIADLWLEGKGLPMKDVAREFGISTALVQLYVDRRRTEKGMQKKVILPEHTRHAYAARSVEGGEAVPDLAREAGVTPSAVYQWVSRYRKLPTKRRVALAAEAKSLMRASGATAPAQHPPQPAPANGAVHANGAAVPPKAALSGLEAYIDALVDQRIDQKLDQKFTELFNRRMAKLTEA